MKTPCRGCQFREVGCHSKCESYIQWRAQLDKYNEQKNIQNDASKYIRDNVSTIRNRMRKHLNTRDTVYSVGRSFIQMIHVR